MLAIPRARPIGSARRPARRLPKCRVFGTLARMTEIRHLPDSGETLFVSDVHLGAGRASDDAARGERLLAFLSGRAAGAARLFVLGDLFDFWFEYRHAVPKE